MLPLKIDFISPTPIRREVFAPNNETTANYRHLSCAVRWITSIIVTVTRLLLLDI